MDEIGVIIRFLSKLSGKGWQKKNQLPPEWKAPIISEVPTSAPLLIASKFFRLPVEDIEALILASTREILEVEVAITLLNYFTADYFPYIKGQILPSDWFQPIIEGGRLRPFDLTAIVMKISPLRLIALLKPEIQSKELTEELLQVIAQDWIAIVKDYAIPFASLKMSPAEKKLRWMSFDDLVAHHNLSPAETAKLKDLINKDPRMQGDLPEIRFINLWHHCTTGASLAPVYQMYVEAYEEEAPTDVYSWYINRANPNTYMVFCKLLMSLQFKVNCNMPSKGKFKPEG